VLWHFRKLRIHHHGLWILAVMLSVAAVIPGAGPDPAVETIRSFVGILFGLITGFALSHLWARFRELRKAVGMETGSLITYHTQVQILGQWAAHKRWADKQRELLDKYLVTWIPEEWHDYHKADPVWREILDSLKELKGKVDKGMQNAVFGRMLNSIQRINEAREELSMLGKNKISSGFWSVIVTLAAVFLFTLFYLKTAAPTSIIFTALLATVVAVLLLAIRDLNNLRFAEDIVSFEPYERVLDFIGKPRFYPQRLIEAGRLRPSGEYRVG